MIVQYHGDAMRLLLRPSVWRFEPRLNALCEDSTVGAESLDLSSEIDQRRPEMEPFGACHNQVRVRLHLHATVPPTPLSFVGYFFVRLHLRVAEADTSLLHWRSARARNRGQETLWTGEYQIMMSWRPLELNVMWHYPQAVRRCLSE
jgi:hypothetical protein